MLVITSILDRSRSLVLYLFLSLMQPNWESKCSSGKAQNIFPLFAQKHLKNHCLMLFYSPVFNGIQLRRTCRSKWDVLFHQNLWKFLIFRTSQVCKWFQVTLLICAFKFYWYSSYRIEDPNLAFSESILFFF